MRRGLRAVGGPGAEGPRGQQQGLGLALSAVVMAGAEIDDRVLFGGVTGLALDTSFRLTPRLPLGAYGARPAVHPLSRQGVDFSARSPAAARPACPHSRAAHDAAGGRGWPRHRAALVRAARVGRGRDERGERVRRRAAVGSARFHGARARPHRGVLLVVNRLLLQPEASGRRAARRPGRYVLRPTLHLELGRASHQRPPVSAQAGPWTEE
jgi:hypothetical protein